MAAAVAQSVSAACLALYQIPNQYTELAENFALFQNQVTLSEMLLQRVVANSVLPPALVRRITTLLDEAHACCDAFTREVQRTDLLGVGCSTAGVLMDVPLGLRRLDNQRQKCLSRLHAVEHTVNSMVSVITSRRR